MPYTKKEFQRDYFVVCLGKLTVEELQEVVRSLSPEYLVKVVQSLPVEILLACLSAEQIREYLERLIAKSPAKQPKPRRKK